MGIERETQEMVFDAHDRAFAPVPKLTPYRLEKRTRQVFETDAGTAWNPSNRPA
jgi:hypothetical protein